MVAGRIAPGAAGGSVIRRAYRRSPLRWLYRVAWDHRGISRDDTILAAYPRSGTMWLRFMLAEMLTGSATLENVVRTLPHVGRHHHAPRLLPDGGRLIKTHDRYIGRFGRALHLVRDPRDIAPSYFGLQRRLGSIVLRPDDDPAASFDRFVEAMIAGDIDAFGSWQEHLLSWRRAAQEGRADVLTVRYEDLQADTPATLRHIAAWLGHDVTLEAAALIAQNNVVDRLRAEEQAAFAQRPDIIDPRALRTRVPNINDGRVGAWRERLTPSQQQRISAAFAHGLQLMGYPPV